MAMQKQDDQHERTFSSYVRIRDVVLKTYLGRWTIGRSGERGSGISVLPAWHDDDEERERKKERRKEKRKKERTSTIKGKWDWKRSHRILGGLEKRKDINVWIYIERRIEKKLILLGLSKHRTPLSSTWTARINKSHNRLDDMIILPTFCLLLF